MNVEFMLNGEGVIAQINANIRLIDMLRDTFGLVGAKSGCSFGICGACTIVFNGKVTKSCLIPAFRANFGEIITIESFAETEAYKDIIKGFEKAGVENCGYCDTGKIFIAETILSKNRQPDRKEILTGFSGTHCRCTETESLVYGVLYAADIRQRRIYGRS